MHHVLESPVQCAVLMSQIECHFPWYPSSWGSLQFPVWCQDRLSLSASSAAIRGDLAEVLGVSREINMEKRFSYFWGGGSEATASLNCARQMETSA